MAFTTVTDRTGPNSAILAAHHNEIANYLNGVTTELARLFSDDDDAYGVIIKNLGVGSKALLVQDNAGATLLDVSSAGTTLGFGDGTVGAPSFRFAGDTDSGAFHSTDPNEWSLVAGGLQVVEIREKLIKVPGTVLIGTAEPTVSGASSDERHQLYLKYDGTGTFALDSPGLSMVDQIIAELNFAPDNDWDVGSILGLVRNTGGAGKGSMRAVAAQMFKYSTTHIQADTQGIEVGVHNAKSQTSHADNAAVYDAFYGTCGITILSYGGFIDSETTGPGVRSNTAIVIGSIGGVNSGFKQAIVYYDTDQTTKLWEVTQNGTTRNGTAGNAAEPTFSFIDDIDTGMFRGGADVLAFSAGGAEFARGTANVFSISFGQILAGEVSPPQITANTDNYIPAGLATARILRLSTDASRNLTGLTALPLGTVITIQNVGSFDLVLVHASASSSAANRFSLPGAANLTLPPGSSVTLRYDSSTLWRTL